MEKCTDLIFLGVPDPDDAVRAGVLAVTNGERGPREIGIFYSAQQGRDMVRDYGLDVMTGAECMHTIEQGAYGEEQPRIDLPHCLTLWLGIPFARLPLHLEYGNSGYSTIRTIVCDTGEACSLMVLFKVDSSELIVCYSRQQVLAEEGVFFASIAPTEGRPRRYQELPEESDTPLLRVTGDAATLLCSVIAYYDSVTSEPEPGPQRHSRGGRIRTAGRSVRHPYPR